MNNKVIWIIGGVVGVIIVVMILRGGSSAQGPTAIPVGASANDAAIEQTRLTAASSAFGDYLASQVATLQSNNQLAENAQNVNGAVTLNAQTIAGNENITSQQISGQEAVAASEGATYTQLAQIQASNNVALAKIKARTATNQSIFSMIGGLFKDIASVGAAAVAA